MNVFLYDIGDIVTIHSPGTCYSRWEEMFERLGFKKINSRDNRPKDYDHVRRQTWIIFNRIEHDNKRSLIYAVRNVKNPDEELLMSEEGISNDSSINGIVSQINYELDNE